MPSLEAPPTDPDRRRERRWALAAAATLAVVLACAALAGNRLRVLGPAPASAVDHGPLPPEVRARVMAILDRHLRDARLEEIRQGPVREFHIQGSARAPLAQEFHAAFRPEVTDHIMPLLRPYGEIISFDIAALDLPPARLRPLPKE